MAPAYGTNNVFEWIGTFAVIMGERACQEFV